MEKDHSEFLGTLAQFQIWSLCITIVTTTLTTEKGHIASIDYSMCHLSKYLNFWPHMGVSRGPDFKPVENMLLEGASFSQQSDHHLCKIKFPKF